MDSMRRISWPRRTSAPSSTDTVVTIPGIGHFSTFSFDYGVDTEAGPRGTVTFEIYGDDKKLFASEKIGRYDLPRHADVNVDGVKMLKLVVTDAGDGITDDHADWLNPKLYP